MNCDKLSQKKLPSKSVAFLGIILGDEEKLT